MPSLPLISKSNFLAFRKCSEAFWIKKYAPDLAPAKEPSPFEQQLIDQGHEVESWARILYPDGVLVSCFGEEAAKETSSLISDGVKVIFQATFIADGLLTMCDILVFNEVLDLWDIYEVKGSYSRDVKKEEHYWDVAFQAEVLRRAHISIGNLYLVELNKEFVKDGEIIPEDLLDITAIDEEVLYLDVQLKTQIESAKQKLRMTKQPTSCECRYKTAKHRCDAFEFFYPDVPKYSIYNISRIRSGGKKLTDLIDQGIMLLNDVPDDSALSEIQLNQVLSHKYDRRFLKLEQLKKHGYVLFKVCIKT